MFEHSRHAVSADTVGQSQYSGEIIASRGLWQIYKAEGSVCWLPMKKRPEHTASGLSYDGATPTKKSIVAWAAGGARSANAASCEGAVQLAAVPPAGNFRNWGRIPAQRWDRKDTPATSAPARNIPD